MKKIIMPTATCLCLLSLLMSAWKVVMAWDELGKLLGSGQPFMLVVAILWLGLSIGVFCFTIIFGGEVSFAMRVDKPKSK